MADSAPIAALLVLIGGCLLVMTVTMVTTACQFRATLRRFHAVLPDAHRSFRETLRLLRRANAAAQRMEGAVTSVSHVVSGALDHVTELRRKAQRFLQEHGGNGAGADPRRHRSRRR